MSSTKTIGIIGGGQLGQMMAISAIYMGHKVIALDPAADCPASRVAEIIVAPYDDVDALRQLADRCDVLTYEFENVDADGLDAVIKEGQLPQGTDLLRISQNRIFEKDFLSNKAQVTVAPYKVVTSSQDLADIDLSKNYVLKTATGGYDGHGQKVIRSEADLEEAYTLADSADCVLEEFVNFDLEISVIVSGNGKDVTVFPVQENIHRNNILSKTIVPARISESLAEKAKAMAVRIAEQLNLSGTLCVEMFATADDIIVNEIAPRPHNSGHYSIEVCDFSQFDTHILGVLGAPLPAIHLHAPAVMLNVLGQHVEVAETYVTENPSAHLHLYGKLEAKHNRKMGHVTLFSDVPDNVVEFGKLISRIANVKIGDKEVNFLEDIVKVESRLQKVELSQDGNLGVETETRDNKMERLINLNPSAAILMSWIEFESKLQDVYSSLFQIEGTDKATNLKHTPFRTGSMILRELYNSGKINKDIYESAIEMSGLRNKIVHAQSDNITEEVAESYVMTIKKLNKYFDNIKEKQHDRTLLSP